VNIQKKGSIKTFQIENYFSGI